jgi:hypothetical protein
MKWCRQLEKIIQFEITLREQNIRVDSTQEDLWSTKTILQKLNNKQSKLNRTSILQSMMAGKLILSKMIW